MEEAEDFDVPDEDPLPMSGFEHQDLVEEIPPVPAEPKVKPAEVDSKPVVSTPEPPIVEPAIEDLPLDEG